MFVDAILEDLAERIAARVRNPARAAAVARADGGESHALIVGVCGSQGSGKSTIAEALAQLLENERLRCAVLSLDDLYLTHAARLALGRDVHPLLRTRGVPGTHDVALGIATLARVSGSGEVLVPRFDKAEDNPYPTDQWPRLLAPLDVVLFEGWCVGARPEAPDRLIEPINELERDEDPDGRWRGYVNARLAGEYQTLFAPIDALIFLKAPSFDVVYRWRREQEEALRHSLASQHRHASHTMSDAELLRFVSHYERITRRLLAEMPERATLTLELDADRAVRAVHESVGLRNSRF